MMADEYALMAETPVEAEVVFYDTFDWRLFNKSLVLRRSGKKWVLHRLPSGAILEEFAFRSASGAGGKRGRNTADFDFSAASTPIAAIIGERRLFAVGKTRLRTTEFRVLNADQKMVARLRLETALPTPSLPAGSAPSSAAEHEAYLDLLPVRGYLGPFRRLSAKLAAAGALDPTSTAGRWQEMFARAVAAAGKQPGAYSARPDYRLTSNLRADEAARIIHRQTLAVMRANEEGIKADWDIEFLHDYRTAVRRTRSALSQIPAVFAADITEYYKGAFGMLGERTNRLRDIDVYLSSESAYRAMLPGAMSEHITPLFDYLRTQRWQALRELIGYLNSTQYAELMAQWEAFLRQPFPVDSSAPNAALPIDEVARRQIRKRYRQVIADGNKVQDHTEDEIVHALRIDCKKLRYLIEFFSSLFPKKEMDRLVGQLKVLQDELGVFNDLSVQQVYLMENAEHLAANDAAGPIEGKRALVAIGFLVARLADEQQDIKPGIVKRFAEFAAPPNRALFRQLFRQSSRTRLPDRMAGS